MAASSAKRKRKPAAQPPAGPEGLNDLLAAAAAVQQQAAPETGDGAAKLPSKPSLWKHHRIGTVLAPLAWTGGADFAAECFRCAVHWSGAGSGAALAGGGLFLGVAAWRTAVAFIKGTGRAKGRAVAGWIGASAWGQIAIWVTPAGPDGIVQVTALVGGLVIGTGHLFAHRQQELPRLKRDALTAPGREALPAGDEREALLRKRLIAPAGDRSGRPPWYRCEIENLHDTDGGFTFEVVADPETSISHETVAAQAGIVASIFDIPRGQVIVDEGRSARRTVFTVLTAAALFADAVRWDGTSTYDPKTGAIRTGRYGDEARANWTLHKPGSGMWGGAIYGAQGTGKSGVMHKIAADAGIVVQCRNCGAYREEDGQCGGCDPSRLFALFMGDPQMQPFSVWKGKADLTFWGPLACSFQQSLLREILDERSAAKGTETYTDKKGRTREGKGWFDPAPDIPGIISITDEWPDVVNGPGGAGAIEDSERINAKGRKAGIAQIIAAQMPDAPWTGDTRANRELLKAFNTIAYRVDGQSKGMLGIKGDASALPKLYGSGFLGGADDRSATPYRTDDLPEDSGDGVDVLDMAEEAASLPVTFDAAMQTVLDRYGLKRGDIVTDEWVQQLIEEHRRDTAGPQEQSAASGSGPAPVAGPVSASVVTAVRAALNDHAAANDGPAELWDLMQPTGLSLGAAGKALAVLKQSGEALEVEPGQWRPGPPEDRMAAGR